MKNKWSHDETILNVRFKNIAPDIKINKEKNCSKSDTYRGESLTCLPGIPTVDVID